MNPFERIFEMLQQKRRSSESSRNIDGAVVKEFIDIMVNHMPCVEMSKIQVCSGVVTQFAEVLEKRGTPLKESLIAFQALQLGTVKAMALTEDTIEQKTDPENNLPQGYIPTTIDI